MGDPSHTPPLLGGEIDHTQTERIPKDVLSIASKGLSLATIALSSVVRCVLYMVCCIAIVGRRVKYPPDLGNVAPTPTHCRAARYATNLDDDIVRDDGASPISAGHALVYQGNLCSSGTRVAIKVVRDTVPYVIKATYREIHVWSKLRHENILPLLGIATKFDRTISLVTEWMPLGNAHDYVQDRSIDPRPLLLHIARGLCYLHEHEPGSIVHGDVKGVNVLISGDGRAVLADFGLSLLINSSFSMTVNPPCGGSWRWLAPENVDSQEYAITHAGDIWAFGMTSLELFTGQNPFPDIQTIQRLVLRILRGPPERPSDEWTYSRMTDDWWELLCSCWQRGPLLRPSMSELVSTIEQLELSGHGIN